MANPKTYREILFNQAMWSVKKKTNK
jgi:hypothetical protein